MKQLQLIALTLILSAQAHTQTYLPLDSVTTGYYNTSTKDWAWGQTKAVNMTATLKANVILIDDRYNSAYVTGELTSHENTDKYEVIDWHAKDRDSTKCTIMQCFVKRNGDMTGVEVLTIIYDDMMFKYVCNDLTKTK